jgi:hypothetical protein
VKDFPSHREIMEARDRVSVRHPKTLFVGLHVGHDALQERASTPRASRK